jgi:isoleucyl-tRNA synthetase
MKRGELEDVDAYYFNIVEEISKYINDHLTNLNNNIDDFADWCISEDTKWGLPIPFFIHKETSKNLLFVYVIYI